MGKIAIGKRRNAINFYKSKNSSPSIFTLVLKCIEIDMRQSQISNFLSKKIGQTISKQRLNYWLRILLSQNYIKMVNRKPILTDMSKKVLAGGSKPFDFDLHNIVVIIPLASIGNLPKGEIAMRNWKYAKLDYGFFKVFVNYGKQPNLMIYPPKTFGNDLREILIKCGSDIRHIVALLENEYQCEAKIGLMEVRRKPHLHSLNDPIIEQMDSEQIQYFGKNIEFNKSGDCHADILGFEGMRKYDQLLEEAPLIKQMLGSIAKGNTQLFNLLAIQTETLNQTKNAILAISKAFERLGKILGRPQEENPAEMKLDAKNEGIEQDDLLQIMVLDHVPSFVAKLQGIIRTYPDLNEGSTIWLERSVADILIRQGKAKKI